MAFEGLGALGRAIRGRRRLIQEGVWVAVGQAATAVGLVVGIRILTEYLTPAEFGNLSLMLAALSLARSVFCVSVGQASLRFYGELQPHGGLGRLRATASRLQIRVLAVPLGAILLVALLGTIHRPAVAVSFVCLALLLVADAARLYEWIWLAAARRQKQASIMDIGDAAGRPALSLTAILLLGAAASPVMLGYALSALAGFLMARFVLDREGIERRASDPDLARELFRYALPLMPMAVVMWVSGLSDRFILSVFVPRQEVGLYAAAYGLMAQPFLMAQVLIDRTLTPVYFLAAGTGDRAQERQVYRALVMGTIAVCAAGVLLVFLFSRTIAALFLAGQYRSSATLMPWLALGNAMLAVQYSLAKPLYAHKRTRDMLVIYAAGAVLSVLVTIPMVLWLGALGAALACPVYYLLQVLLTVAWIRRMPGPGADEPRGTLLADFQEPPREAGSTGDPSIDSGQARL